MRFLQALPAARGVDLPRLGEIERDLGIVGFQKPVWDIFVETFEATADRLQAADSDGRFGTGTAAPELRDWLLTRADRLAVEAKCMRELIEITDILYRSLTARQRVRADRLLRPLCSGLGSDARSAR